jgi:hypothetical protein
LFSSAKRTEWQKDQRHALRTVKAKQLLEQDLREALTRGLTQRRVAEARLAALTPLACERLPLTLAAT